jgi:dihydropteroate synthase
LSQKAARKISSIKLGSCVLKFDEPRVMGIVNNTPDSFSGDGIGGDTEQAVARGLRMFESGAAIVDVGGESTRPGATPVTSDEEMTRTISVVERLAKLYPGRVSIDTMKPEVAEGALYAGASLVNDVSGFRNEKMIEVVAEHDAAVIIMHMLGEPRTMQKKPIYKNVVGDIIEFLTDRVSAAESAGVSPGKIMVDPGIGFGKTIDHNLEILGRLSELRALGKPVVIGVSRKAFIGKLTSMEADKRLEGSIAAAVLAVREGANIVRAHDVPETVKALKVAAAIITKVPVQRR